MLKNKVQIRKYSIIFSIMLLSFLFYYKYIQNDMTLVGIVYHAPYMKGFLILGFATIAVVMLTLFLAKDMQVEKLPKCYFLIAMLLGTCYLFLVPLFAQSDEPSHYLRANEISNGSFVTPYINNTKGNFFDQTIQESIYMNTTGDKLREYKTYSDMKDLMKVTTNHEDKVFMETTASNYSILNYIPHVIGFWFGKLFAFNPYFCGLLGRFLSLLFCVSLATLGLKILPQGKFFAFTFLLTPTFLSYSASYSADGSTIVYCFLLTSFILMKRKENQLLKWYDYLILMLLIICTSIAKIVYVPFAALILFLPKDCFKNRKREIIYKVGFLLLGILMNLGWQDLFRIVPEGVVVSATNNSWIFTKPLRYLFVLVHNAFTNGYNYLENMFAGEFLCHWQVRPFAIINFGFILVNLFAFLSEEKKEKLTFFQLLILVGIIGIVYVLVSTAIYQSVSLENSLVVQGIQGRYFTPLLCLLLFIPFQNTLKMKKETITVCTILLNYMVLLETVHTFLY